jgi:hypothetical protein
MTSSTHLRYRLLLPSKSKCALHSKAHKIHTDKNALIRELKRVLPYQQELIEDTSESVKDPDLTSDLHNRITYFASVENLDKLDAKMKEKFKDRFTEIPHTSELRTDIYHHIKLKNPNQMIAAWTYSCP